MLRIGRAERWLEPVKHRFKGPRETTGSRDRTEAVHRFDKVDHCGCERVNEGFVARKLNTLSCQA